MNVYVYVFTYLYTYLRTHTHTHTNTHTHRGTEEGGACGAGTAAVERARDEEGGVCVRKTLARIATPAIPCPGEPNPFPRAVVCR